MPPSPSHRSQQIRRQQRRRAFWLGFWVMLLGVGIGWVVTLVVVWLVFEEEGEMRMKAQQETGRQEVILPWPVIVCDFLISILHLIAFLLLFYLAAVV